MSQMLAWARNAAIAWGALTLSAVSITHLLAALFGYGPLFGEPVAYWFSHPLYEPWRFLHWGLELAPHRPWIAFLCVLIALVCVLAAFAVLALASLVAPADLPQIKSQRGFVTWDKLGQRGIFAANGLALGAVKRFVFSKPVTIYAPAGNIALVGAPHFTGATLIAAASTWPGALVFVDACGMVGELKRQDIIRFAPGRGDSASLNPLLAIGGGPHAWVNAQLLAHAMLGSSNESAIDAFAVLILDQLIQAPLDQRNLAGIRARLSQPRRVLTEISAAWAEMFCVSPAPQCEIARAVRSWRAQPNAALAHLAQIDAALAFLSDGTFGQVTRSHQLRFADLVAAECPRTLVLEFPRYEPRHAAPLMATLLAQLVATCTIGASADPLGKPKKRTLLIVIESEALKLLAAHGVMPILAAHAGRNGCHVLVQASSLVEAGACETIAAIGRQTKVSAEMLSELGGEVSEWRLFGRDEHSIRAWALPTWVRVERPIVLAGDLIAADATQTMVFTRDLPPIRARSISVDGPPATILTGAELKPVAHDWEAPPAIPIVSAEGFVASSLETPSPTPNPAPTGAAIRAALTRRAPPKPKARSS